MSSSASMAYSGTTLYAGFWRRVIAYIIDAIVVWVVLGVLIGIISLVGGTLVSDDGGVNPALLLLYPLLLLGIWLYFALMESSASQATLGKMALSIKVTDLEGRRIGFGRATVRWFGKFISGVILYIGFMMAGWTAKKQALHDMMAGTLVIRSL
jgi:uncharacterized RDD family membrane protein YckC